VIPGIEILTPVAEEASASIITFATTGSGGDVRDWAPLLQKQYRIRPRPVSEHGLRGLRISAHVYNTYAEVDRLVVALSELAKGTRTA
jgi:selenocysteine lyase/cysteine desulfurase